MPPLPLPHTAARRYRFAFRRKLPPDERLLDLRAVQVTFVTGLPCATLRCLGLP